MEAKRPDGGHESTVTFEICESQPGYWRLEWVWSLYPYPFLHSQYIWDWAAPYLHRLTVDVRAEWKGWLVTLSPVWLHSSHGRAFSRTVWWRNPAKKGGVTLPWGSTEVLPKFWIHFWLRESETKTFQFPGRRRRRCRNFGSTFGDEEKERTLSFSGRRRRLCPNFGSTFCVGIWSEIYQFQGRRQRRCWNSDFNPQASKLSVNWVTFDAQLLLCTQIYYYLFQCQVSCERRWCPMGFYPTLKRSIQCWIGNRPCKDQVHPGAVLCGNRYTFALVKRARCSLSWWSWQNNPAPFLCYLSDSVNFTVHSNVWSKSIQLAQAIELRGGEDDGTNFRKLMQGSANNQMRCCGI